MERRAFVAATLGLFVPLAVVAQQAKRLTMLLTGSASAPVPEHDAFMKRADELIE
jgi:hypothetical protein